MFDQRASIWTLIMLLEPCNKLRNTISTVGAAVAAATAAELETIKDNFVGVWLQHVWCNAITSMVIMPSISCIYASRKSIKSSTLCHCYFPNSHRMWLSVGFDKVNLGRCFVSNVINNIKILIQNSRNCFSRCMEFIELL